MQTILVIKKLLFWFCCFLDDSKSIKYHQRYLLRHKTLLFFPSADP